MEEMVEEIEQKRWRRSLTKTKRRRSSSKSSSCLINNLDDGCLMHIFSFISPIRDGFTWHVTLACGCELTGLSKIVVEAARPVDTILIAAGGRHLAYNIQIKKRLCLISVGEQPDETTIYCFRGSDSPRDGLKPTLENYLWLLHWQLSQLQV
ncbi:hypothetical protein ACFX2I_019674 [Malus domestica]